MANLKILDITRFRGINRLHTRDVGQFSDGKNFVCVNGRFKSRPGMEYVPGIDGFSSKIDSIHEAGRVQVTTRLFVEEGGRLWRRLSKGYDFEMVSDDVGGNGLHSTSWGDEYGNSFLILVSGANQFAYEIAGDSFEEMVNLDDEDAKMPSLELVTTYKGYLFGWSIHYYPTNLIRLCGYNDDDAVSIRHWPLDFAVDPTYGAATETVYNVIPRRESLVVLTDKRHALIYGNNETNLDVVFGGFVVVDDVNLSDIVGDVVLWLGTDKRVYAFSGTSA
jgi:hypothetical protein